MADLLSRYPNIDGVFTEGGMQQGVVRAYLAAHRKLVPVSGTDENGFACQVKQYNSKGLEGVQVSTAMWADAVALKQAVSLLQGKKVAHFIPGSFVTWNTAAVHQAVQPEALSEPLPRGVGTRVRHQPDPARGPEVHAVDQEQHRGRRRRHADPGFLASVIRNRKQVRQVGSESSVCAGC